MPATEAISVCVWTFGLLVTMGSAYYSVIIFEQSKKIVLPKPLLLGMAIALVGLWIGS